MNVKAQAYILHNNFRADQESLDDHSTGNLKKVIGSNRKGPVSVAYVWVDKKWIWTNWYGMLEQIDLPK